MIRELFEFFAGAGMGGDDDGIVIFFCDLVECAE